MTEEYYGWTNYATWRVYLEFVKGTDEMWKTYKSCRDLADSIHFYVYEILESESKPGISRNYAVAFIRDVDWKQIARQYCKG